MAEFVHDCPRCRASRITFDVAGSNWIAEKYDWAQKYEVFSVCRGCRRGTIFVLGQNKLAHPKFTKQTDLRQHNGVLNHHFVVEYYINMKHADAVLPPEHLPDDIDAAFREGATCMTVNCFNAAGTMFRLCLDFATKSMLPENNENGLNNGIRYSLGKRLEWLFDNDKLPEALRDLSICVKDDGNDGAHDGSLDAAAAEDLQDFTVILLERLYTEKVRVEQAIARRKERHKPE